MSETDSRLSVKGLWARVRFGFIPYVLSLVKKTWSKVRFSLVPYTFVAMALVIALILFAVVAAWAESNGDFASGRVQMGQSKPIQVDSVGQFIVSYPARAYLGQPPSSLFINLKANDNFTMPTTVTLELPPGLRFITSGGQVNEQTAILTFEPELNTIQQQVLQLENTGLQRDNGTGEIHVIASGEPIPLDAVLIEGTNDFAWRQLLDQLAREQSPLLLTLAVAVPLLAAIVQFHQKWREERRHIELQQREEAEKLLQEFRAALARSNLYAAEDIWDRMTHRKLRSALIPKHDQWAETLLEIASGKVKSANQLTDVIEQLQHTWGQDTVAGTLVCGGGRAKSRTYSALFRHIALEQVTDSTLRDKFIVTWRDEVKDIRLLTAKLDWHHRVSIGDALMRDMKPGMAKTLNNKNPLAHERAEDELRALFDGNRELFWPAHPLCASLLSSAGSCLIVSKSGSGRTALARWLENQQQDHSTTAFPVLFNDVRDSTWERELALSLLHFVTQKPISMCWLNETERGLLGGLLAQGLAPDWVRLHIDEAIEQRGQTWLKDATNEQRLVWERIGRSQLAMLRQAVPAGYDVRAEDRVRLALPLTTHKNLRKFFLFHEAFADDQRLKSLFVQAPLASWRDELQDADSIGARVENVIDYLFYKQYEGQNGLVWLLRTLESNSDNPEEQQRIRQLIEESERYHGHLMMPTSGGWFDAALRCVKRLGFPAGLRFIIDLPTDWTLLPFEVEELRWLRYALRERPIGVRIVILCTEEHHPVIQQTFPELLDKAELTWNVEQLHKFLKHRFVKACGWPLQASPSRAFESEELYNEFIGTATGKRQTPRHLIQLFNCCLNLMADNDTQITRPVLEQALQELNADD